MKRYESLNGLRAMAAIGIVMMHVRANIDVEVTGNFLYRNIIPVMSDFVFLFMMVSAFSLCCGYYDRFKNGSISLNEFYKKRYSRILPFFSILVLLSVLIPHSPNKAAMVKATTNILGSSGLPPFVEKVIEGLSEMTLGYGLLPNPSMSIMGVGWFLGVIFIFYMMFPFFVFMIDNKRRAWLSLLITNMLCYFCLIYYFSEKFVSFEAVPKNFLYNAPFFVIGGLVFLYKDIIECFMTGEGKKWLVLLVCATFTMLYWLSGEWKHGYGGVIIKSVTLGAWLIFAVGCTTKVLHNSIIDYLSGISMEIYLSHMMSFRIVQFIQVSNYIHNNHITYFLTCLLTLGVAIVFSHVVKYVVLPRFGLLLNKTYQ